MVQPPSITSLPPAPEDDRRRRMVHYSIAMGIRVVCVVACFFVRGWWLVVPVIGAVLLPYLAVVIANVASRDRGTVLRPGSIERFQGKP